jgi:branched-chain amino acid transport system substrate-binding protein
MASNGMSRREMLQRSAFGVGGLAVGGLGGFLIGNSQDDGGVALGGNGAPTGEPIRVVGIFPLTGIVAADGEEMRNGTVMAIDEINDAGGILGRPIEYIEIDDGDSLTDDIVNAFRRAVDTENPDVIVSGYHLATGPEFDIVADAEVLYFNLNTQTAWVDLYQSDPDKYWGIFQVDPTEAWYGIGFAEWINDMVDSGQMPADNKVAAILGADDPYGSSISRHFEERAAELGWDVSAKETFTPGQVSDWGPLLSRVRRDEAAVLFTTTFSPADNAAMVQQFIENPMPAVLYQQYGPSVPEYLELAGSAAEGVVWSTVLGRLPDDKGQAWVAAYEQKFGSSPGFANAPGNYDLMQVYAKAVIAAGDPNDYRAVSEATENVIHRGVTGGISFEDHAGLQYPHQTPDPTLGQSQIIVQIQNGEHVTFFPEPYTNGEFQLPPWV